jgi:AraC-like DNA-binding protein
MDTIADIFKAMQVSSVVHSRLEATAPWGLIRHVTTDKDSRIQSDGSENSPSHVAHFGMVSRGNCWLTVDGVPDPIPLTGGDCFLLGPGSAYALRDDPRTPVRIFCEIAPTSATNVINYGGGGAPTTIISGWFRLGQMSIEPLKRLLPDLILVRADQARSLALHTTLQWLASEMAQTSPGVEVMVNRLADILFIQCVRAHITLNPETCKRGLLHAIFDPQIGAALRVMHEKVELAWTVESLAAAAGMSRSAFALRFKEMLGETPLEYLTNWRMYKATGFLEEHDKKLFDIAKSVGYNSDAAFSKAFRRVFGIAPRQYRQRTSAAG